jgi:hypothetical protein
LRYGLLPNHDSTRRSVCTAVVSGSIQRSITRLSAANIQAAATTSPTHRKVRFTQPFRSRGLPGFKYVFRVTVQNTRVPSHTSFVYTKTA